jgi:hypothetical protein
MRLTKSLLVAASTLALGTGTAFAGQDSTIHGSVETSPPEMLSEQYVEPGGADVAELEAGDVLLIAPADVVTYEEYYLIVPESDDTPS